MHKIIVFGTGKYYREKKEYLKQFDILCLVDNDEAKQGCEIDGIKVVSPEQITEMNYDYICIMASRQDEIITQLLAMGVKEGRILKYFEIGLLNENVNNYFDVRELAESEIVIFSHLMNYTGAAIALYNFAKVLKKAGYKCAVFSMFDGPLKHCYEDIGVTVYEEDFISIQNSALMRFLSKKRLIVCNTIVFRYIIEDIADLNVPVMWWIHEALGFHFCNFKSYKIRHNKNLHVYGVGELVQLMYKEKFLDNNIKSLLFMVDDNKSLKISSGEKDKKTFAIIGGIYEGKGQDVFVDAIRLLPREYQVKCSFYIIGKSVNEKYYDLIKKESQEIPELEILGELSHKQLEEKYRDIDVVVCASRNESMSMVVVEALQNKKCCIVSKAAGISRFIEEKKNGLLLENVDAQILANKMMWVIDNADFVKNIEENGYKIYKKNFSREVFEQKVRDIVVDIID